MNNLVTDITTAIINSSQHVKNDIRPPHSSMNVNKNKYYFFSTKDTNNNNKNKYLNIFKLMTIEYKVLLTNTKNLYCNPNYNIELIKPKNNPNPLWTTFNRTDYLLATHFIESARQKIIHINNSLLSKLDMKETYKDKIKIIYKYIKGKFDLILMYFGDQFISDIKDEINTINNEINTIINNLNIFSKENNSICPTTQGGYKKSVRNKKAKKRTRKSRKNKKTRKFRRKSRRIRR